jgi:ABC-type methionine transport system ATPase subunit
MEFNLDFLRKTGEALSSFGKKEVDTDERTSVEKYDDFLKTSKVMEAGQTADQKAVEGIDDTSSTETVKEVLGKEEKKNKEDTEDSLEKKLANIEKVIDKFSGGTTTLPSSKDLVGSSSDNINIRPLDMGQIQAKAIQEEYLKPSSVPNDRIALLYKDLEKYNLI